MSDKKINTFFHLICCSRAKNSRFITSAGGGVGARAVFSTRKKTVKKSFTFFISNK
jgi:hypothetical protein